MALSADRNTTQRQGRQYEYEAAADKVFYAGCLVVLNSSGYAEPATAATAKIAVGRCDEALDTTGLAAGAERVRVKAGIFKWEKNGTVDRTSIGDTVYIHDDATVKTSSSSTSAAGILVDVDAVDGKPWVMTEHPAVPGATGLLAANNLSDVGTAATARANIGANVGLACVEIGNLAGAAATRYGFVAPAAITITKMRSVLLGHALATGDATLTGKIAGVAITGGVITITQAGSAIGDLDSATPSAANTATAGQFVEALVGGTNDDADAFALLTFEYTF